MVGGCVGLGVGFGVGFDKGVTVGKGYISSRPWDFFIAKHTFLKKYVYTKKKMGGSCHDPLLVTSNFKNVCIQTFYMIGHYGVRVKKWPI